MKRSFTAGSRTALVMRDEPRMPVVTANIREHSRLGRPAGEQSAIGEQPMRALPPPGTFAEGQRLIYGLLAAAAGMFCGACAVAMIALLMWGRWSAAEEHSIVIIFGWSLGGFIAAMTAVIVGLLAGGPVGRFKVSATREGASLEADNA
jgi:hypothetical protein